MASVWLCVIEQTLSPPGPQFPHLENEESGQDHLRGDPYCLLSTVQKAVPWPQELNTLPTL